MKKKIPIFRSDKEAEAFGAYEDMSSHDLSGGQLMQFEFKLESKSISIRLSEELLIAVQKQATREGVPYQRFIRQAIERAVAQK